MLLLPSLAWPVELKHVDLTYKDYFSGGRSPLLTQNGLPDRRMGKEIALHMDTDVLTYGFFNNVVHGASDEDIVNGGGQFRTVGWQFELGFRLTSWLDVSYVHHSQHVLDTEYRPGFPVEDGVQLRFRIYEDKPRYRDTVLAW